jgi:hypothetical protein
MTKLEIDLNDDVISIVNKIHNITDPEIELIIPEGAVILENILNLKLISKKAAAGNKSLQMETKDERGQALLSMLNEEEGVEPFANFAPEEQELPLTKHRISMPKIKLPTLNIKWRPKLSKKIFIGIGITTAVVIVLLLLSKNTRADIKIVVNSQPLARSIQITVDKTSPSDKDKKILRGMSVSASVVESSSSVATGEKTTGKKATGKIKVYNLTDTAKEFKKGSSFTTSKDDGNLSVLIKDAITVPATTYDESIPPVATVGEIEVEADAENIGEQYNLEKDMKLEVDGYKKSLFTAAVSEEFSGGTSKKVKIVTKENQDALTADLTKTATQKANDQLAAKMPKGQKYIQGSTTVIENKDSFDKNIGDEADKITLTKSLTVSGLAYSETELDELINKMMIEFIPSGYVISSNEKEIGVQILGKGDNTQLSGDKADLQVTIKAYVVPDIKEDELKDKLKGKSAKEAQDILNAINNIKTYSINIPSKVPFFRNIPNDTSKIFIEIERE